MRSVIRSERSERPENFSKRSEIDSERALWCSLIQPERARSVLCVLGALRPSAAADLFLNVVYVSSSAMDFNSSEK